VRADLWAPLPFGDEAFDVVLALHGTLAHPPEREAYGPLGREVARVLRAGGPFVAEVPSRAWVRGLPPEGIAGAQGRIRRVADDRLVHEDESSGLAVEAIVPDEDEWRAALGASFDVRFGRLSDAEVLVVGARRALSRQSTEG
jgi:SAM-dependent methyltransferase